jgi:hypothetical protein
MRNTLVRRPLSLVPALFVALLLLGSSTPVFADYSCFQNLRDCYLKAAGRASWVDMWLAGLDCELTFGDCTRRALTGH